MSTHLLQPWTAAFAGLLIGLAGVREPAAASEAVEAGRQIVLGATEIRACAECHGEQGQGGQRAGETHPRLTNQNRFYLRKQIDDFAAGTRTHEDMTPIARALSETQREAVAAYYASIRTAPYPPRPGGDPLLLQQGGILSASGAPERSIRACALCHAGAGAGIPPGFPYLAGQLAAYTERQMQLWKRGERRNDPLDVMGAIARAMSDEEIRAVALYFARVRLPPEAINDLTGEPRP